MRVRLVLVLTLLGGCRKAPPPTPVLQLETYADVRHKVTFQYPFPWALTHLPTSYLPGPDLGLRSPPSAVISVNRGDEPRLQPSDFEAAVFVYAIRPGLSAEVCAALAGPGTADIGGTIFYAGERNTAATIHTRTDRLYSISRGSDCFLFDLALLRLSTAATRPMTAREQLDIETELQQLLASVSFQ